MSILTRRVMFSVLASFAALLVAALPALGFETWDVSEEMDYFDVKNTGSQSANDFHLHLEGVSPEEVSELVTGWPFDNAEIEDTGNGITIKWSDTSTLAKGNWGSFGFELNDNANLLGGWMQWTYNGDPISDRILEMVNNWKIEQDKMKAEQENTSDTEDYWIARSIGSAPCTLKLADLKPNGVIWNSLTPWDPQPVCVSAQAKATCTFTLEKYKHYIVGYTIYADNGGTWGSPLGRFCTAAEAVPEPGMVLLLGLGGLTLAALAIVRR